MEGYFLFIFLMDEHFKAENSGSNCEKLPENGIKRIGTMF